MVLGALWLFTSTVQYRAMQPCRAVLQLKCRHLGLPATRWRGGATSVAQFACTSAAACIMAVHLRRLPSHRTGLGPTLSGSSPDIRQPLLPMDDAVCSAAACSSWYNRHTLYAELPRCLGMGRLPPSRVAASRQLRRAAACLARRLCHPPTCRDLTASCYHLKVLLAPGSPSSHDTGAGRRWQGRGAGRSALS